jgi:hypothetical protein
MDRCSTRAGRANGPARNRGEQIRSVQLAAAPVTNLNRKGRRMKIEREIRTKQAVVVCDRCGTIKGVLKCRLIVVDVPTTNLAEGDLCEKCRVRAKASFVRHERPRKGGADAAAK